MISNFFNYFDTIVHVELQNLIDEGVLPPGLDLTGVAVEPPRDAAHGDIACNAAMVLAKRAAMAPRDIAAPLAERLRANADIREVEIAGPGFLNLALEASVWDCVLAAVLDQGDSYGAVDLGRGEKVNVEYVSANPTGPMHVGHCRGAVVGDALASLLARAGYDVTREYYINDAGAQIDVLARSVVLRYREALGEEIGEIPAGLYPGDYLVPVGKALADTHGEALLAMDEAEWLPIVRPVAIDAMMAIIRADLARLHIHHDVFFSERSLIDQDGRPGGISNAIAVLEARDLVYEGRLPPPKGQLPEDWEDRDQLLFRATQFGDDVDRPLLKSDGTHTYFAADIAYHLDKFQRGFANQIDVWGADHGGYVKRLKAAGTAITGGKGQLDVKICQLVRLLRAGEPVKMSKRTGDFVTLADVVGEVGADPVRFMMLYRKNDAPLDFDFAKVTEQSRDNPVFYVQYAHARIHSVFRQAAEVIDGVAFDMPELARAEFSRLTDKGEIQLIRRLALYPRLFESAARNHEAHRVAFYLYDLAGDIHSLWTRGKELPQLRFIQPYEIDNTYARLALLRGAAHVLGSGLSLLGVAAPEEMV